MVLANATVVSLDFTIGPSLGGTHVTVTGTNFVNSAGLVVKFGSRLTTLTFVTASTATCIAPSAATTGAVAVEVSNNNADFTANGVQFTYLGTLSLHLC